MPGKYIKTEEILNFLQSNLSTIRTGRVNKSVLDNIRVDAYGSKMKIEELASVSIPEASQLLITPFDKANVDPVARAIGSSDLNVNPNVQGGGIRLNFPALTEERRKELVKVVKTKGEEAAIQLRLKRKNFMQQFKKDKEAGMISEDELQKNEKVLQDEVDVITKELHKAIEAKITDIMKV